MASFRTLIVSEYPLFAMGVRSVISRFPGAVVSGVSRTVTDACRTVRSSNPELVVVSLGGALAASLVRKVRSISPGTRFVVFTAVPQEREALDLTPSDALLPLIAEPDAVVDAIRAVLPRRLGITLRECLSSRELEVARLIAEGRRTSEIADKLYISQNTVKTHLAHILHKLKLRNRLEVARWWHTVGGTGGPVPSGNEVKPSLGTGSNRAR